MIKPYLEKFEAIFDEISINVVAATEKFDHTTQMTGVVSGSIEKLSSSLDLLNIKASNLLRFGGK